ncbi:MAG: hypothetical protein NZ570_01840 [Candidatus Caldarchaeum sp.]|nr:hypothetical protein [Candidatus Caldarchaeum sp.]MDW8359923.1 hypothetical protein [Candidatus Caldarchaeum sp.]
MVRASLAVEAEIAEALSRIAEEKHMTLYSLTNQMLRTCVELLKENFEVHDMKNLMKAYWVLRDVDAVVLPSDFMDSLIAELYARDREGVLKKFRQMGQDVGKYLKVYAETVDDLLQLAGIVGRFFPLKKLDVKYISRGSYEVAAIGVGGRIESTQCVLEAMKGIFDEYGAKIQEQSVAKGLIKVRISSE